MKRAVSNFHPWMAGLAAVMGAVLCFLWPNNGFVPMWIEGFAEYEDALLAALGFVSPAHQCALRLGDLALPLALNSYSGAAAMYLHFPAVAAWTHGVTLDPYAYRYVGIIEFVAAGCLFFFLLREFYPEYLAFCGATIFLTIPNLLLFTITDWQVFLCMILFILCTALCLARYFKGASVLALVLSSAFLGITLTTRAEAFVWSFVPLALYLVIVRPPLVLSRWAQTKHKPLVLVACLASFCAGAASIIGYNILCPYDNVIARLRDQILPTLLSGTSGSPGIKAATRIGQIWSFNLLNNWSSFDLRAPNYPFAVLWVFAIVILAIRWVRQREASLPLLMTLTSIPFSLVVTGGVRQEHLAILQPLFITVIVAGLAQLERVWPHGRRAIHAALVLLVLSGVLASALDWRAWNAQLPTDQTMLNQSDPVLLAEALAANHSGDRIFYTNIGMARYVQYVTRNRIRGEDIMNWFEVDEFTNSVRSAVMASNRRRVFVAVSPERDGLTGTLPRTTLLYSLLDQYRVPYTTTKLSNSRNKYLYDLIVIDEGITPFDQTSTSATIIVSSVVANPIVNGRLEATIRGSGFKPGDAVIMGGTSVVLTAFGSDTWITFSIPWDSSSGDASIRLEVFRPSTLEKSLPFLVSLSPP